MTEAYIYDAVRTPRGKGKKSGSCTRSPRLSLATQALQAVRDRNNSTPRMSMMWCSAASRRWASRVPTLPASPR